MTLSFQAINESLATVASNTILSPRAKSCCRCVQPKQKLANWGLTTLKRIDRSQGIVLLFVLFTLNKKSSCLAAALLKYLPAPLNNRDSLKWHIQRPNPKIFNLQIYYDSEKPHILLLEKLQPEDTFHFIMFFKKVLFTIIIAYSFSIDQSTANFSSIYYDEPSFYIHEFVWY